MSAIKELVYKEMNETFVKEMNELEKRMPRTLCSKCEGQMIRKETMHPDHEGFPVWYNQMYCIKCKRLDKQLTV